ncbi:MAG: AAA family ATPase [Candidatus Lokiarchaeota archaeon]|nr:AAA family ATPase [Candidatus Lokiarchaeota archaeon]
MEFKDNFLVCLTGLPASGKSTFAHKLRKEILSIQNKFDVVIIDVDEIRGSLYKSKFNHEKEVVVRDKNLKLIEKSLKEKKIVISDDINYYSSMRHDLKEITDRLKQRLFIIYISTPIKVCLKWNRKRDNPIPNDVILNINEKFDKFQKYNWDHPDFIIDMSEDENFQKIISEIITEIIRSDNQPNSDMIKKKKYQDKRHSYAKKLDLITRKIIGNIIINHKYDSLKNEIIKKRKEFLKDNLGKKKSELEIKNKFIEFLEMRLKIKIL